MVFRFYAVYYPYKKKSTRGHYLRGQKGGMKMATPILLKAIGVCNFNPKRLTDLCLNARIKPMVNQVECAEGRCHYPEVCPQGAHGGKL